MTRHLINKKSCSRIALFEALFWRQASDQTSLGLHYLVDIATHLWGQIVTEPKFLAHDRHFPAKRAKYWNVHLIELYNHWS